MGGFKNPIPHAPTSILLSYDFHLEQPFLTTSPKPFLGLRELYQISAKIHRGLFRSFFPGGVSSNISVTHRNSNPTPKEIKDASFRTGLSQTEMGIYKPSKATKGNSRSCHRKSRQTFSTPPTSSPMLLLSDRTHVIRLGAKRESHRSPCCHRQKPCSEICAVKCRP